MTTEFIKLLNELREKNITSIDDAIKSLKPKQLWVPPKDTLIYVWDGSKRPTNPDKRYSTGKYMDTGVHAYGNGRTSVTAWGSAYYDHWEPIPDAPSAFNWQENTGVMPECRFVFIEFNDGSTDSNHPSRFLWFAEDSSRSIKQFVVLC